MCFCHGHQSDNDYLLSTVVRLISIHHLSDQHSFNLTPKDYWPIGQKEEGIVF